MLRRILLLVVMLLLVGIGVADAQSVTVNRANKSIDVTVTEKVQSVAEFAQIQFGVQNYGRTKGAVFKENAQVGNRIVKALLDAGVPKADIETRSFELDRAGIDPEWSAELRKERQFEAKQSWVARVPVEDAERLLSLVVAAGVTEIGEIEWMAADWDALEARAYVAALSKARSQAQQLAKEMGAKVGELLYVSNTTRRERFIEQFWLRRAPTIPIDKLEPTVKLFPKKVSREATVQAVFALE